MASRMISTEIYAASLVHLSVLDEFIRIVEGKLEAPIAPFLHESLTDLLTSLSEQRETYSTLVDEMPRAA
ncbi:MAG TPA: hypothetical protein VD978_12495 [Azospirillum sp.]|nr:hypothetical protein [Azospirillum sp.]